MLTNVNAYLFMFLLFIYLYYNCVKLTIFLHSMQFGIAMLVDCISIIRTNLFTYLLYICVCFL